MIAGIAQAMATKWAGAGIPVEQGLIALLKADPKVWNEAQFAKSVFLRLAEFAQIFGFSGVSILVDKVDETTATTNSSAATARLLYPLLANNQLLEAEHFSWLFFLWDKVQGEYSGNIFPVRLDKIPNATIAWDNTFLVNLVARRLENFSNGAIHEFRELCDPAVEADVAFDTVVRLSMRSPRELIRILDTIFREHDDDYASSTDPPPRLLQTTIPGARQVRNRGAPPELRGRSDSTT